MPHSFIEHLFRWLSFTKFTIFSSAIVAITNTIQCGFIGAHGSSAARTGDLETISALKLDISHKNNTRSTQIRTQTRVIITSVLFACPFFILFSFCLSPGAGGKGCKTRKTLGRQVQEAC
jgi:hypothetical protein